MSRGSRRQALSELLFSHFAKAVNEADDSVCKFYYSVTVSSITILLMRRICLETPASRVWVFYLIYFKNNLF